MAAKLYNSSIMKTEAERGKFNASIKNPLYRNYVNNPIKIQVTIPT